MIDDFLRPGGFDAAVQAAPDSPLAAVATAAHSEPLIHGLFKAMMSLFDIAILMGHSRIVPGRLHAVVVHQCLVAFGSIFLPREWFLFDRRAQMIVAMLLGHAAQLSQGVLNALSQR